MLERWAEWTPSDRLPQGPRRALAGCVLGSRGPSAPSCQPTWFSFQKRLFVVRRRGKGAHSLTGDTITSRYLSPS